MAYCSQPGGNVSLKPRGVGAKDIDLGLIHTTVIKADETAKGTTERSLIRTRLILEHYSHFQV